LPEHFCGFIKNTWTLRESVWTKEEAGKGSTRRNKVAYKGHQKLPCFALLPLKQSHPAQRSMPCFSFPLLLSLFRGHRENKGKVKGPETRNS